MSIAPPKLSLGPFFTPQPARPRDPEAHKAGLVPLNLVMEWASPAGARSVELFDFQEKDFPNLQFEQILFPARQLPVDIECSEFRTKITPTGKEAYLPLDALLVALYERGVGQQGIDSAVGRQCV